MHTYQTLGTYDFLDSQVATMYSDFFLVTLKIDLTHNVRKNGKDISLRNEFESVNDKTDKLTPAPSEDTDQSGP